MTDASYILTNSIPATTAVVAAVTRDIESRTVVLR